MPDAPKVSGQRDPSKECSEATSANFCCPEGALPRTSFVLLDSLLIYAVVLCSVLLRVRWPGGAVYEARRSPQQCA